MGEGALSKKKKICILFFKPQEMLVLPLYIRSSDALSPLFMRLSKWSVILSGWSHFHPLDPSPHTFPSSICHWRPPPQPLEIHLNNPIYSTD